MFKRAKKENRSVVQLQMGRSKAKKDSEDHLDHFDARVDIAPLWLNVDQDSLLFIIRFAFACYESVCYDVSENEEELDDPMLQSYVFVTEEDEEQENKEKAFEALESVYAERAPSLVMFDHFSVSSIEIEIDFRAKGRRMDTLFMNPRKESKNGREMMYRMLYWICGLLSVNESKMTLETILIRRCRSDILWDEVSKIWFPQVERVWGRREIISKPFFFIP